MGLPLKVPSSVLQDFTPSIRGGEKKNVVSTHVWEEEEKDSRYYLHQRCYITTGRRPGPGVSSSADDKMTQHDFD